MSNKRAFHVFNIIVLLLLISFNLLVLFAFGIGEDKMTFADWCIMIIPFIIWAILYRTQSARSNTAWRIAWFFIMVAILFFWQTGLGATIVGLFR